jgi:hypothetical protein
MPICDARGVVYATGARGMGAFSEDRPVGHSRRVGCMGWMDRVGTLGRLDLSRRFRAEARRAGRGRFRRIRMSLWRRNIRPPDVASRTIVTDSSLLCTSYKRAAIFTGNFTRRFLDYKNATAV